VRHEIVHNKQVVEELKEKGAIFVDELSDIKDRNRPVIFSAHGVPKSVPIEAKLKNLTFFDATCPLVSKIHREVEFFDKKNYEIILIGHKDHPEVVGTMGQINDSKMYLVENIEDAKKINILNKEKVAYVTQTTLSVDDTSQIIKVLKNRFPNIKEPKKEDICYATTNRQEAVKKIAPLCDMFFVVGSKNSSNSLRLVEVAKKSGCINSELIPFNKKLPINSIIQCNKIGITSGASAPEKLVQDLIVEIKKYCSVSIEEVVLTKENVTFKLPKSLN